LDICDPQSDKSVQFAGLAQHPFLPASLSQAVAALSAGNPLNPSIPVYATARYSPAISGMAFRNPEAANACDPAAADPVTRDLTLIPSESFYSSAFWPNGADVRGILFSGSRAFVLHRNDSDTLANPAAVAVLDRSPLPDGKPSNNPIALLQVCNGPTELQMHDAGRGDRIYVTCYDDGQIYVIDPAALVVTAIIDAGAGPTSLVFSRDKGIAYVASYANSHLSLIDLTPGSPTENRVLLRIGLPHGYGE
jgi:YVTN family beta-propeller protein